MVNAVLTKTGKIFLVLCLLIPLPLSAYEIKTTVEPSSIDEGESATLSVSISGSKGDTGPARMPDVQGLSIEYSGIQHSYQFVNGKSWSGIVLNYSVTGMKKGSYTIPSFPVKVDGREVLTQPVRLNVLAGNSQGRAGRISRNGSSVRIAPRVEIFRSRVYTGEPVVMRYYVVSGAGADVKIKGFEENPAAPGCIMKEVEEVIDDRVIEAPGGEAIRSHVQTYVVIPAGTGRIQAGGGTIVATADNRMDFFSFERPFRLEFDKQQIEVLSLPAGAPSDFSGTVGSFTLNAESDNAPVKTYQEKKITVTVRGSGNMLSMSQPVLKTPEQVQLLVSQTSETIKPSGNSLEGERRYTFTLIPHEPGTYDLGKITLSYFDPQAGRYLSASSGEIKVTAEPGGAEPVRKNEQALDDQRNFKWIIYVVIAIIICGTIAAIYMMVGREKLSSLMAKRAEVKMNEEKRQDVHPAVYHLSRLRELARPETKDEFLKEAWRIVESRLPHDGPDREKNLRLKDELSRFRFGGGPVTQGDMESIINELAEE